MEEFEVPRHPKREDMGTRTIPFGRTIYIEREDFFDLEGPEGHANNNRPPKGFKRLLPNEKVRLRYAYVIQCTEIVRDPETQEPVELKQKMQAKKDQKKVDKLKQATKDVNDAIDDIKDVDPRDN